MFNKQFGGRLTEKWISEYRQSENWRDGSFKNLTETQTAIDWRKLPGILCKQIKGHKEGNPVIRLPVLAFNHNKFFDEDGKAKFIWYGHSVLLIRLNGLTILIDPMFGNDASPIGPVRTKRFSEFTSDFIRSLPDIDLMLISHDHYDHLDYQSITMLKDKVRKYFTALGVKRHLLSWGMEPDLITEFDWWDTKIENGIEITFTPSRHFSGRGINSIAKCLWGGWSLKTDKKNYWFSGDGGYGEHFAEIGRRLGPVDLAFMECGQYCEDWAQIHMFPDEAVKAAIDAKVKSAVPVHWGAFNLSYFHSWYDPVESFVASSQNSDLKFITPALGALFNDSTTSASWWVDHKVVEQLSL